MREDENVFEHGHASEWAWNLERAPDAAPGDRVRREPLDPISVELDLQPSAEPDAS